MILVYSIYNDDAGTRFSLRKLHWEIKLLNYYKFNLGVLVTGRFFNIIREVVNMYWLKLKIVEILNWLSGQPQKWIANYESFFVECHTSCIIK